MTPTPSAREPQDWSPEKIGDENDTPALRLFDYCGKANPDEPAVLKYTVGDVLRDMRKVLREKDAAYDALAAEREAITRLAGSLQDDVAALREAEESLTRQRDEAEQRRIMADECLAMIYQKLVQIKGEESMKSCPPMFYPEAIHNINAAKLHAERERDALRAELQRLRDEDYERQTGMMPDAARALDQEARG